MKGQDKSDSDNYSHCLDVRVRTIQRVIKQQPEHEGQDNSEGDKATA